MKKLVLALLLLLPLAAGGTYMLVNQGVKREVDGMIERAVASGSYQDITYEELSVAVNGDVRLSGLRLQDALGQVVVFEDVVVSDYDKSHDLPHYLNVQLRGLRLPAGLPAYGDSAPPEALQRYVGELRSADGLIPLEIESTYRYRPEDGHQLNSEMRFSLPGAGEGHFRSITREWPLEAMFATPAPGVDPTLAQMQMLGQLASAEFPLIEFSLSDGGIIEHVLNVQAEQAGMAPADFRELTISRVSNLHLFAPQGLQEPARELSTALAAFLEGGKTLNVSLQPAFEGRVQQLQPAILGAFLNQDYAGITELLNLEVRTQ